jgi:hypothetical protein
MTSRKFGKRSDMRHDGKQNQQWNMEGIAAAPASETRVGTYKFKNLDNDFEPGIDLNQPVGGQPALTANCAAKARL